MFARQLLAFTFALSIPLSASAVEVGGVKVPDTATLADKPLVLNGAGIRTKLMFKVYVGALYVEKKSSDAASIISADAPKMVVLHITHSKIEKEKLTSAWKEGFEANSKAQMAALATRIDTFNGYMTDVVEGDQIEVAYIPGTGTKVKVKGKDAGTIEGKDFADAVFSIWLGPNPVHDGLKKGMLGKS